MSKFDETNKLYDKYAKEFADKLDKIPETKQLDEFMEMIPQGASILDLGCGSGRDAEYFHKAGFGVIGVDLSEGLIKEASIRRPEIDFSIMDIMKLDFPDESFDGVWSKLTILHVERTDFPQVLAEAHRVLRPEGVLMIETKAGEGEAYEAVSFNKDEKRLFVYYGLEELKRLFAQAGFFEIDGYEYGIDNEHATHVKDRVVVFGRKLA